MYGNQLLLAAITAPSALLAQHGRFAQVSGGFRESPTRSNLIAFLVVMGSMALLAGAVWLFTRWYTSLETQVINNPRALFRDLCRAHRLGHADRKLLREIATWHGIADPSQLFVDPERLQSAEMRQALACEHEAQYLEDQLFAEWSAS